MILKDEEERRFRYRPLGLGVIRGEGWDGAWADIKWLMPWITPQRKRILKAFAFFIISTLSAVSVPRIVAKVVDDVLIKGLNEFPLWITILFVLMFLKISADITYKWMITKMGQTMTKHLRADVFHKLGVLPLSFFDLNTSGRLISRCVNDVSNLSAFFTANFFTALSDLAIIIGCLVMMFTLSPFAMVCVLFTLLPFSLYMLNTVQANMRYGRDQRHVLSRLSSHTGDTMNNLGVLHSQPYSKKWARRHAQLQQLHAGFTTRAILTWGSFSSLHVIVMGLTYTAVIILGIHQIQQGDLTVGSFIATCTYVMLIYGPFLDIADKCNTMLNALGSAKRLRALSPSPHQLNDLKEIRNELPPQGNITFEKVNFSYRGDRDLFRQLDLVLNEGEVTALVGRTGSGKTTLAHLLLGLYPIQGGQICWGEEDIMHLTPERRARWVAQVSQDLFLFTDTLRENLRLWNEAVTDEAIYERLSRVGLAEKTSSLPLGLDTIVKAETLPFSQGEKQLLLLCRALIQDPRLLVFDEATASLDQKTEDTWLEHVAELFAGRTTLFIAHRLETLRLAHRVVVLHNGKVMKDIKKKPGEAVSEADLAY